jgi:hypothetical protein
MRKDPGVFLAILAVCACGGDDLQEPHFRSLQVEQAVPASGSVLQRKTTVRARLRYRLLPNETGRIEWVLWREIPGDLGSFQRVTLADLPATEGVTDLEVPLFQLRGLNASITFALIGGMVRHAGPVLHYTMAP